MATWDVTFYPENLYESGTASISGNPDTGYPEARLYDRSKNLLWKRTPDTVTNLAPAFAATPNWSNSGEWTEDTETASIVSASGTEYLYKDVLEAGETYDFTVSVSSLSGGSLRIIAGSTVEYISSTGLKSFTLKQSSADTKIYILVPAGVTCTIDASITCVESEDIDIDVDLGAGVTAEPDFLAIAGHNLDGADIDTFYSSDGSSYSAGAEWTQSGNDDIIKTSLSLDDERYFRVSLSGTMPGTAQIGEVYLSVGYSFNCLRSNNPTGYDVTNNHKNTTIGGSTRTTKVGDSRRHRTYSFWLDATAYSNFNEVLGFLADYSKPFYFKDHEDNYFLAEFDSAPEIDFNHNTYTLITVNIIEIL